jgi:hypothetical protein
VFAPEKFDPGDMSSNYVTIAGGTVDLDRLPAAIRAQMKSPSTWFDRDDCTALDGVVRALRKAGPHLPRFADAICELLVSPDVSDRSAACYLLSYIRDDVGATRINAILRDYPAYFVGVASTVEEVQIKNLEFALLESLAEVVKPKDKDSIFRLQLAVDHVAEPWVLMRGLARVVPQWVCDNARRVSHSWVLPVLIGLPNSTFRQRFVDNLAPWPADVRDDLLKRMYAGAFYSTEDAEDVRNMLRNVRVVD